MKNKNWYGKHNLNQNIYSYIKQLNYSKKRLKKKQIKYIYCKF